MNTCVGELFYWPLKAPVELSQTSTRRNRFTVFIVLKHLLYRRRLFYGFLLHIAGNYLKLFKVVQIIEISVGFRDSTRYPNSQPPIEPTMKVHFKLSNEAGKGGHIREVHLVKI